MATRGISLRFTAVGVRTRNQIAKLLYDADRVIEDIVLYADDYADAIVERLKDYPPPPPNSKYVRTGDLGRSWRYRESHASGNISFVIYNNVTDPRGRYYATYVQGPEQVAIHEETGWITLQDAMDRAKFANGVQRIVKSYI